MTDPTPSEWVRSKYPMAEPPMPDTPTERVLALCDNARPAISKVCTCSECESIEGPWPDHPSTVLGWTLDPAEVRKALSDD